MKNYNVTLKLTNNHDSHMCGFAVNDTFEPGYGINLLFHDIFEHFFEETEIFSTEELSQAGECVAMGIREYFSRNSSLVERYAGYNQYQGIEWNSWMTILGQIGENLDEDGWTPYPNDFNYKHLPEWKKENDFEDMVDTYNKYDQDFSDELKNDIETAYSYGYWLGEHLFEDRIYQIDDFCKNLVQFLEHFELDNTKDMHDPHHLVGAKLEVTVGEKIEAMFSLYGQELASVTEDEFIVLDEEHIYA